MLENNAINYLHEMGIDIWIPRTLRTSLSPDEKFLLDAISQACQIPLESIQLSQVEVQQLLRDPLFKKTIWLRLKDKC